MSFPGVPGLSPEAVTLQQQFMATPDLLKSYYEAHNAGRLQEPQSSAFRQLLAAASRQQAQQGTPLAH
jgi:hypothetical protein